MNKYKFYTCDVFTDVRFGGNPLAVLPKAEGLSSQQMQKIAREFNYSETSFVFSTSDNHTKNVRIFTPTQEVPFAGHPNIGTAFTLAKTGQFGHIEDKLNIVFEEKAGPVPITIHNISSELCCELKAPESLSIGQAICVDLIARALSLRSSDIVTSTHQPVVASVGLPFIIVEINSRAALQKAHPYLPAIEEIHAKGVIPDILIYVRSEDEFDIRARMFAPLDGVPEDPATGSANCALAAMLSDYKRESSGEFCWRISQGVEMKRPSILNARIKKKSGVITGIWIAGNCKMVSEGFIDV